ncbi:MAG: ergothioneine biosynthesis protein EgtB [Pseudomonadales bacterium]|nr:ergothioneine biosynthesis protein EgtB [Halieaceae bacterium]MCP5190869.1 ergothioneine biosynthesis protein EgtB [Pseudomonadales bacterium]
MLEPNLLARFLQTREQSLMACRPLVVEDYGLQAEAFTSPPKWHLAHTSWFFETFLLIPFLKGYQVLNDQYQMLFNSYYNGIGQQYARPQRGLLSRPTLDEVSAYRAHVDSAMTRLLENVEHPLRAEIIARSRLGIEHEQQHQELFYTDLKYSFFANPLYPAYLDSPGHRSPEKTASTVTAQPQWREFSGGLVEVGKDTDTAADSDFAFDNEGPANSVYLNPYALADRLVTNEEYQAFIADGGYQRPEFWLADGWAIVQERQWRQPLYWLEKDSLPLQFTLRGLQPRQPDQPVCHLSGYEADAYASWAGARLPTEFEWEAAARAQHAALPDFDPAKLHPAPASGAADLQQLYGDCWQWTGSAYRPYPGFRAGEGAIGEYNGKFMANQWVLRGGSCVSQQGHVRPTYRNFFYPHDRWQFSGLRLARDL